MPTLGLQGFLTATSQAECRGFEACPRSTPSPSRIGTHLWRRDTLIGAADSWSNTRWILVAEATLEGAWFVSRDRVEAGLRHAVSGGRLD
jgi:hypothetical protein